MTVLTDTQIEDQRTPRGAKVGQNSMYIHRPQESYHKNRRIRLDVLANRHVLMDVCTSLAVFRSSITLLESYVNM